MKFKWLIFTCLLFILIFFIFQEISKSIGPTLSKKHLNINETALCWESPENFTNQSFSDETQILFYVVRYATAMMECGRDVYGDEHSPLFASALNHETLKIDTSIKQIEIPGLRYGDRSLTGSNPLHDKYLYSTLYLLSETTGNIRYGKAADEALEYFFASCQSPNTGLMTWGEHIYWDFITDTIGFEEKEYHEAEAWPLWDRVYALAPDAAFKYAIGLWNNQVADIQSGDFSRHTGWLLSNPQRGADYPRYAGQMMEVWAEAYARPEYSPGHYSDTLLLAIEVLLNRMEQNRAKTTSGYLPAFRGAGYVWTDSNLELTRCLGSSAKKIDDPQLAERLKIFANELDNDFFKAPHLIVSDGGFAVTLNAENGTPIQRSMNRPYSTLWESGYGYITNSFMANKCFDRYIDLIDKNQIVAEKYKEMILFTGNQYLNNEPDTSHLIKPRVVAETIQLMLNCYSLTTDEQYINKAIFFSELAINLFFDHGSPLPKASNQHNHYESITGGPQLIYAMLQTYNIRQQASE